MLWYRGYLHGRRLGLLIFHVILACAFAQLCNGDLVATPSVADLAALRVLHETLEGQLWTFPVGAQTWNFSSAATQYCQWFGVSCCPIPAAALQAVHLRDSNVAIVCDTPGAVVALELQSMNLQGVWPPWDTVGSLRSLAVLNVSLNQGEHPG